MRADARNGITLAQTVAVVELWICFALGVVNVACGVWGICVKPNTDAIPDLIVGRTLACVPLMRVAAVACIGLGVVLLRLGMKKPDTLHVSRGCDR